MPHSKAISPTDFQELAKLLGVEHFNEKTEEPEPRWRRLEVLRELKELDQSIGSEWDYDS
ncbi:hypothetical protein [Pleionea sp. CnH1-48]|uniref:hypothetical protein n=1 Tax=Pleionea sp. CnH1-48 TaxID=2954494 RepID=UPI0020986559|nr:hypothetical protein [Pleionea sp. CnH1-48]MCO7227242.1 hypothetical protein [Pleionea sp. CnH1-48]